jgi:hypothetical protein
MIREATSSAHLRMALLVALATVIPVVAFSLDNVTRVWTLTITSKAARS